MTSQVEAHTPFSPYVAGIGGSQSVDIEADVSQGQVEHEEVAGRAHLLDPEEGQYGDGVK